MTSGSMYDVIVVGGGFAGSSIAGALARSGLGVLVIERESAFRDRIRGELTFPWGVRAIRSVDLYQVVEESGLNELSEIRLVSDRRVEQTVTWSTDNAISYNHPDLQERLLQWAVSCGATSVRSARAIGFSSGRLTEVRIEQDGTESTVRARLVIAANGEHSAGRRWTGGEIESDPEHHRFGGVLVKGLATQKDVFYDATAPGTVFYWFWAGPGQARIYFGQPQSQLQSSGASTSLDQLLSIVRPIALEGALDHVQQAGPLGFFPNQHHWATRIAGDGIVLIGDAAGKADPTVGMGTSLTFRDVRELSELLLAERDWHTVIGEFATRRRQYYQTVRTYDRWNVMLNFDTGLDADRRRERNSRALQIDPTLGGLATFEETGPDGLNLDDATFRHYFGEDLP